MKLAVFTKNRTNPAYHGARIGADRAAALHKAQAVHYVPETPDDPEQQSALIEAALKENYDAFVMSPVHPFKVDDALRKVEAAGIPLVSVVSPVTAVPCHTFVHSDDYSLAIEIARHLFEHLQGRGRVLVVSGHVDSTTSLERLRGFADAAAQYPDISLIDTIVGDYVKPVAYETTKQWLARNVEAELDACLVANDIMALGVLDALDEAQRSAAVVGVNAIPEAIPVIEQGKLLATADFNAMRLAYIATEAAVHVLKGGSLPSRIALPVEIVTRENCHQWNLPYEQRSVLSLEEALAQQK